MLEAAAMATGGTAGGTGDGTDAGPADGERVFRAFRTSSWMSVSRGEFAMVGAAGELTAALSRVSLGKASGAALLRASLIETNRNDIV